MASTQSNLAARGKGRFRPISEFWPQKGYNLLPFNFERINADRCIITNECGEFLILTRQEVHDLTLRRVPIDSPLYRRLATRHFVIDDTNQSAIDLLAVKVRTKRAAVQRFTALHMYVVTLRCNQTCNYCQVSRQSEDRRAFDMSTAHIDKALAFTFRSPSPTLKIEFLPPNGFGTDSLASGSGIHWPSTTRQYS